MIHDLRYALRVLAKSPAFAVVAVLTLALGIGATTGVFTVVHAVLLRPLAYRDPQRLVTILHGGNPVSPANFYDLQEQSRSFGQMAAAEAWGADLTGRDKPEHLPGVRVTPELFPLLGIDPILGRVFTFSEERGVILSHRLWQRRFGADPAILQQTLILNGQPHPVLGVMPADFQFPPFWFTRAELWAPLPLAPRRLQRGGQSLRLFARLKPGVTVGQAQAEMDGTWQRLAAQYPQSNRNLRANVTPLHENVVGNVRSTLVVLLGAVALVLLAACANVANLLLARAAARRKEMAIRVALGAGRRHLVRQLLTESLLLSLLGAALGLALASSATRALLAVLPEGALPRAQTILLDPTVLAFTLLLSVFTTLLFGLLPLSSRPPRLPVAVTSQLALACILLIAAGLLIRSFRRLQSLDPGFNPRQVLSMVVSSTGVSDRAVFYQELLRRVRSVPGVESAGAINHLPLAGDMWNLSILPEGYVSDPRPVAVYRVTLPGYFQTMGLPLAAGRDFTDHDTASAPRVVIVNETFARRFWPNQSALGRRIRRGDAGWLTIIGVARDARQSDWIAPTLPEFYVPYLQEPSAYLTLVVRGPASGLAAAVQNEVWSLDRDVPISQVATLDQVITAKTWRARFSMSLMAAFAVVALALAAVGIYGVVSYAVVRRTREIGIRMALGARPADVRSLILRQTSRFLLAGVVLGLAGALLATRLLSTLLYGVRPTDPVTFLTVPVVLAAVGLLAAWLPARRGARTDPWLALRQE